MKAALVTQVRAEYERALRATGSYVLARAVVVTRFGLTATQVARLPG